MKNVLCKLGIHKPDKCRHYRVIERNGPHKWHTDYIVCSRCGKRLRMLAVEKRKEGAE